MGNFMDFLKLKAFMEIKLEVAILNNIFYFIAEVLCEFRR